MYKSFSVVDKSKVCGDVQWLFIGMFVSAVSADIAKCHATRPDQHIGSLLGAEWQSVLTGCGVPLQWGRISVWRKERPFFGHTSLLLPDRGF